MRASLLRVAAVLCLASLTPSMDRLIVPSEAIARKVHAEGREAARFAIIPNGIDLSRFSGPVRPCALRGEYRIPPAAPLLGVVARLAPEKGHRHLIDAMPAILGAVPETWLAIIGEGSEADALRDRAAALGSRVASRVVFTGRRDDVSALTSDLTLAVLPSIREAQGISLLEAMARGVPVVASAVGGIPEVVDHGITGFVVSNEEGRLVPPGDSDALADAIVELLRDDELRLRLGEAGRQTVVDRFSIDAQVRAVEAVYDEELARAGVLLDEDHRSAPRPNQRAALELPPI